MQNVSFMSGAWCGDNLLRLPIPINWKVREIKGNPPQKISTKLLLEKINQGIGTKDLINIAKNRKNAVIVIDDIMRPTPTADILPTIVKILTKSGLSKKDITVVIASGSHQKAIKKDMIKKVGKTLYKELKVIAHNDVAQNLVYLGKTKLGSPIYANKTVVDADLKISLGGIYPHPIAGFSGGAKTFVPGICGLKTITHIHAALNPAHYEGQLSNQFRTELNIIAKKIGLEYSINAILTPDRKVADIFSGDMQKAHQIAVSNQIKYYSVHTPDSADVIISNTYPYDGSYYFFSRGFWPLMNAQSNAVKIALVNGSMTKKDYSFKELAQSKKEYFIQVLTSLYFVVSAILKPYLFKKRLKRLLFNRKPTFFLYYSGDANPEELKKQFPYAFVSNNWKMIVRKISSPKNKKDLNVSFFPYASLQLPIEKQ